MQVEYLDSMGDDLSVVNAARVSFAKWKEEFDDGDAVTSAVLVGGAKPIRKEQGEALGQKYITQIGEAWRDGGSQWRFGKPFVEREHLKNWLIKASGGKWNADTAEQNLKPSKKGQIIAVLLERKYIDNDCKGGYLIIDQEFIAQNGSAAV